MVNPCCNVPEGDVVEPTSPRSRQREGEGAGPPSPGNQPPRAEAPRKHAHDQAGPSTAAEEGAPPRRGAQGQSTHGAAHAGPPRGGRGVVGAPRGIRIFRPGPQIPLAPPPDEHPGAAVVAPPRRAHRPARLRRRRPDPRPSRPVREPSPPRPPSLEDLNDPSSIEVNYGHRTWPIDRPEMVISGMMEFMWPGRAPSRRWKRDETFTPRVRRLGLEFNQYGLPQTVHADHTHEALQLPPGALNPSWRCDCWRHLLGENWFNDTDTTLLARLGSEWNTERDLLIHLLKRLITAMTISYRNSPDFHTNNPHLTRKFKDKWPLESITLLKKMMIRRGKNFIDGENWDLDEAGKKLTGELTGLPVASITQRIQMNHKYRRGRFQFLSQEEQREALRKRRLLTPQEALYWEEYVLPNRLMDPTFTWTSVSPEILHHYLQNIHEDGPDDPNATKKVKNFVQNWFKNSKGARGYDTRQDVYACYNIIARGVGGTQFDHTQPEQNNEEWIRQACEQVLDIRRKRVQDLLSGRRRPTDEEMRAEDLLAREIEEALDEQEQEQEEEEEEDKEEEEEEVLEEEVEGQAGQGAQDGSPGPIIRSPAAPTPSGEVAGFSGSGSPNRGVAAGGGDQELELPDNRRQQSMLQSLLDLSTDNSDAVTGFFDRYLFQEDSPYRQAIEAQTTSPAGSDQQTLVPLAGVPGFPDIELNVEDIELVTELSFALPTAEFQQQVEPVLADDEINVEDIEFATDLSLQSNEFQQQLQPLPTHNEINVEEMEFVTELPLQSEEFHQQVQYEPAQPGSPIGHGKRVLEEEPDQFPPPVKRPRHLDPRLDPGASGSGPRSPPQEDVDIPTPRLRGDVGIPIPRHRPPSRQDVSIPAPRPRQPLRRDVHVPTLGPQRRRRWRGVGVLPPRPQSPSRGDVNNPTPRSRSPPQGGFEDPAISLMIQQPVQNLPRLSLPEGVDDPTPVPLDPMQDLVEHLEQTPRTQSIVRILHYDDARAGRAPMEMSQAPPPPAQASQSNVLVWPPEFGQAPALPVWGQDEPRLDQLHDPNHSLINYGHRVWPIADTNFFIAGMMGFVWPGAQPHLNYPKDTRNVERVTRLVNEFNQYGLPQTVHADIRHETLNPAPEVLNPSWRCPCWRHLLGENWFNDTDATIIHRLGREWTDDREILNHLLKRLITAMVNHYVRVTRAECLMRNPNLENPRSLYYKWSAEQIQIYDTMLERRGTDPFEGRNWDLTTADKKLVCELTGIPIDGMNKRIRTRKSQRKKLVADEKSQETEQQVIDRTLEGKRKFQHEEMFFWDEYLLPRRLREPFFNWTYVDEEIKEEFRNLVANTGLDDQNLDYKMKVYVRTYMVNQRGRRGYVQRMAAYEMYNKLAAENNAPPYNPRAINENNQEWITQASNQVLEEWRKKELDRLAKKAAGGPSTQMPTDAEMGEAAQAAQDLEVSGGDRPQVPLGEEGGPQEGSRSPRASAVDRVPIQDALPRIEHPEQHVDQFQLDPIPQPMPGTPFFDDLIRQLDIAIGVIPPGPPPPSPSPPRGSPAHALSAGSPLGAPAPATSALPSLPPQSASSPRDSPAHALSAGSRPGAHASSTIPLHDPPAPVAGASAPSPRSLHASSSLSGYAASGSSPDSHVRQPLRGLGSSSLSGYAASGSSPDSHVRQARRAPVRLRPPIQEGLFLQPSSTRTHTTGTSGSRSDPPAMPSLETGAFRALESGPGSSLGLRVNIAAAPEQFLIPDFTNIQIPQTLGLPSIIALSIGGSQTQGSGAQPRTSQSPSLKQKARESAEGSRGSGRAQATTQAQATALVQHSNPDFTQLQVPATQAQGQEEEQLLAHLSSQGSHSEGKAQSPARTPTPTPADAAQTPGTAESQVGPNSQVGPIRVQVEQRRGPPGLSSGSGSDAHNQSQEAGTSGNTPPMIRTEDRGSPVTQAQLANQADGQAEASGILGRISLGTPPVLSNISGIGSMDFDMFDTDNEAQAADQARSQAQAAASNQVQAPETSGRTPPPASHALSMEFFDFDMFEADGGSRQAQVDVVQGMPIEGEEARIEHVDVDVPTNQRARSRSPPAPNRSPAHQRDPPPPTNRSPRR